MVVRGVRDIRQRSERYGVKRRKNYNKTQQKVKFDRTDGWLIYNVVRV